MTHRFFAPSLIALALALPAPVLAQSQPGGFQLPPNPAPTENPRVQGPVDENEIPIRPRPTPTPTPRPTAQPTAAAPTPTPAPAPTQGVRPAPQPGATVAPARPLPSARPSPAVTSSGPVATPDAGLAGPAPALPGSTTAPATTPAPFPTAATTPASQAEGEGTDWLLWLGALAALGLAGAGAAWALRRKAENTPPPVIEPPLAAQVPRAPAAVPAPAGASLTLRAEAIKLTRSFAFATLDYRLTLINRTQQAMTGLDVKADLVSAHGNAPMEDQVALPGTELPAQHALARLAPGQSQQVEGQVRLPLASAQVIRQGRLPLLVPLLRLRVDGAGEEPLTRTLVIGQGAPGSTRLQPFNLEEPPRAYQPVAQRELA